MKRIEYMPFSILHLMSSLSMDMDICCMSENIFTFIVHALERLVMLIENFVSLPALSATNNTSLL